MWPWSKRETRDSSYTDALVSLIVEQSSGATLARPASTGALEASASIIARCFAAAQISGPPHFVAALGPSVMSMIGRSLIRQGEILFAIEVRDGRVLLTPAASWAVEGDSDPASWRYRLVLGGPSRLTTLSPVAGEAMIHIRLQSDPEQPWKGVSPLASAALAGRLSAETVMALADEASGPRGMLLPIPTDGQDATVATLKTDLKRLRGQAALVESTSSGWAADGSQQRPRGDWESRRLGAAPGAALIEQAELASREVFAACGIPLSVVTESEGTGQREGYRRLMHSTIAPLGRIVAEELSAKFETDISLSFESLFSADLAGRARAFQSLVGGGMDVAKAAALAGLMEVRRLRGVIPTPGQLVPGCYAKSRNTPGQAVPGCWSALHGADAASRTPVY